MARCGSPWASRLSTCRTLNDQRAAKPRLSVMISAGGVGGLVKSGAGSAGDAVGSEVALCVITVATMRDRAGNYFPGTFRVFFPFARRPIVFVNSALMPFAMLLDSVFAIDRPVGSGWR